MESNLLTLGPASLRLQVLESRLRYMCNLGEIPFVLVGRTRAFRVEDLDAIRQACIAKGYLKPELEATAG